MIDWKLSEEYGPLDVSECFADHVAEYPGFSDWCALINEAIRENIKTGEFWTTVMHKPSKGSFAFEVTLPLGHPDCPPSFTVDIRECLLEEMEIYRPGGPHSGKPITGEDGKALRKIAADFRALADELDARLMGDAA